MIKLIFILFALAITAFSQNVIVTTVADTSSLRGLGAGDGQTAYVQDWGWFEVQVSSDAVDNVTVFTHPNSSRRWILKAGTNAETATIAGISRNVATHVSNNNIINVADFGADGSDSSDDYAAIQAAIDSLTQYVPGIIYFPRGTYYLSQSLVINSWDDGATGRGIILQGAGTGYAEYGGWAGTCIRPLAGCDTIITIQGHGAMVKDIRIEGNSQNPDYGIYCTARSYKTIIENVQFEQFRNADSTAIPIYLSAPTCFLNYVNIDSCDYGIYATNVVNAKFTNIKINGPHNTPMYLRYGWGASINNIDIEDGFYTGQAIELRSIFGLTIDNIYYEATRETSGAGADFIGWYEDDFYTVIGAYRRVGHSLTVRNGIISLNTKGAVVNIDSLPPALIGNVNLEDLELLEANSFVQGFPKPNVDLSVRNVISLDDNEPYYLSHYPFAVGMNNLNNLKHGNVPIFYEPSAYGQGDSTLNTRAYLNIFEYDPTGTDKAPDSENDYCFLNDGTSSNYYKSGSAASSTIWDWTAGKDVVINIWVKLLSYEGRFIEKGDFGDSHRWIFSNNSTKDRSPQIIAQNGDVSFIDTSRTSSPMSLNQWHMITLTMNAADTVKDNDSYSGMRMYIDGELAVAYADTHLANYTANGILPTADNMELGRALNGYIDNLSIHKGEGLVDVFPVDSIRSMFNSGNPIDLTSFDGLSSALSLSDSLLGYFKFEEGLDADTLYSSPDSTYKMIKINSPTIVRGGVNTHGILQANYHGTQVLDIDQEGNIRTTGSFYSNGTEITGSGSSAWGDLTGVPAGFADGIDNTSSGGSDSLSHAGVMHHGNDFALIDSLDEHLSGVFQPDDSDLDTYAGITPSANIQSFLAAANYAAMKALLDLEIGTDVQAYDADLDIYAAITPHANAQSLLQVDYANMRALLDLQAGTDFYSISAANAAFIQSGDAEHDNFSDFVANEHIDWTQDQGATNIHSGNYTAGAGSDSNWVKTVADTSEATIFKAKTDTAVMYGPWKLDDDASLSNINIVTADSGILGVLSLTNKDYGDITANGVSWTIDQDVIDTTNAVDANWYTYIQNHEDNSAYEPLLSNEAGLYAALSDVTNFLQTGDAIAGDDITDGTVDGSEIDESSLDLTNLIDSDDYVDGSIDAVHIASGVVPADTVIFTWGLVDTVYAETLPAKKMPYAVTIIEIASYTDANTTTFNIEERAEATPGTAGTDALAADQVADTDQQEATSFSNAGFAKGTWMTPVISATGDVAIFGITVTCIKQ